MVYLATTSTPKSYGTSSTQQRLHDAGRPSIHPKEPAERERSGRVPRNQPEDCRQVAQAYDGRRRFDEAEAAALDCARTRGGSDHRRLPPPHAFPLDDCLYALQPTPPTHALVAPPVPPAPRDQPVAGTQGKARPKERFKKYPIGYVHLDIAEVRTEGGKLYLFVAIDRTSKVCYAELHEQAKRATAVGFLRAVIEAFPYELHTVLTDNGIQFTHRKQDRYAFMHLFDRVCAAHGIEHRLTKLNHPWTNGQVERMNRTIKEATVKRYHYGSHAELREHLSSFLLAYNHAKRLKTLRGLTPYEFVCAEWQQLPDRSVRDPTHHTLGPYT